MAAPLQILWINDELNGPENGLAQYHDEKLWFVRNSVPSVGSVPSTDAETSEVDYTLIRLAPELLAQIEADHIKFCQESGAPLAHGDPVKMRRRAIQTRIDFTQVGSDGVEVAPQSMGTVKVIKRAINYQSVFGDYVTTVKSSDFQNLNVPRRVEYLD